MRILILSFILLSDVRSIIAQQQLAEFPIEINQPEVQAFQVGDSLFITFKNDVLAKLGSPRRQIREAAWISADGKTDKYYLNDLSDKVLINIAKSKGLHYFYFLEQEDRETYLKAQTFNGDTKARAIVNQKIFLEGPILASFKDAFFNVICYDFKTQMLVVYVLDGMTIVAKHEIKFNEAAEYLKSNVPEFHDINYLSGGNIGTSQVKIIKQAQTLYVLCNDKSHTTILKISLPTYEYQKVYLLLNPIADNNTFVQNDILYMLRWPTEKKLELDVWQLFPLKKINTFTVGHKQFSQSPVYLRNADEDAMKKKTGLGMFTGPPWTLLAIPGEKGTTIRIGAYYNKKAMGVVVIPNPVVAMITFAISSAMMRNMEYKGSSNYYYLLESNDHSSIDGTIGETSLSIPQKIDEYELLLQDEEKVMYKGYTHLSNTIIGVYVVKRKLKLIRFLY